MTSIATHEPRQVIVSGATGFVGQHLVPLLLNNNFRVMAIARDASRAATFDWYKDVEFIAVDLHQDHKTVQVSQGVGLIHLAWQGLPNYKSLFHLEENLPLNYRLVKDLILRGVSQVLITGTCFEYGFQSGPIASTSIPLPNNPYALAKDTLRRQLEFLSKEHLFRLQWARLFYMYGKGQNPKSVLSQLDIAIENGDSTFNMSGGEQLRDYLPIEVVAQQLFDLYVSKRTGTYNICSGNPISIRRLVEDRIKETSASIKLNFGYYQYPDYEPMAFWGVPDIQSKYQRHKREIDMDDHKEFNHNCNKEIQAQGQDESLRLLTREWFGKATQHNYSYHFEWLGRPIIQFPQDIVGVQQLLWQVKPDLIIETGIARGGSLIFYASILELLAQCGGPKDARVLGIDIDIRAHNKAQILAHPMSKRIKMIEGSSIDLSVIENVKRAANSAKKVLVCLDSNHTHDHVLQELHYYAPMVSVNSYIIVFDTVVEDLSSNLIKGRPWSKGNNPKTAVLEYLKELDNKKNTLGIDGQELRLLIDKHIEDQLLITVAPSGFLRRV